MSRIFQNQVKTISKLIESVKIYKKIFFLLKLVKYE